LGRAMEDEDVPTSLADIFHLSQFLQNAFGQGLPQDFVAFVVEVTSDLAMPLVFVPKLELGNEGKCDAERGPMSLQR
jgi:hypothetical protein